MDDHTNSNEIPELTQPFELDSSVVVEHIDQVRALHEEQSLIKVILNLINGQLDISGIPLQDNREVVFSDILLHEGSPVSIRQTKRMTEVTDWSVTKEQMKDLFEKLNPNWEEDIRSRGFDRGYDLTNYRLRANCFKFLGGQKLGAVIRINPPEPLTFEQIGLPTNGIELAKCSSGLILVVGDTCQGKSTTLASIVDNINRERSGHIITAEDPIETIIPNRHCIVTQREVGKNADIESFYVGALDALRERPDVIMFGEIRDRETATEALALAESGPLVLGSLHARTPEQAITKYVRLLGDEKHHFKAFDSTLRGIICQSLVPELNGDKYILATEVLKNDATFHTEIAGGNIGAIRNKLQTVQNSMNGVGSHTMNSVLVNLVKEGRVAPEDALKASTDKEDLRNILLRLQK